MWTTKFPEVPGYYYLRERGSGNRSIIFWGGKNDYRWGDWLGFFEFGPKLPKMEDFVQMHLDAYPDREI